MTFRGQRPSLGSAAGLEDESMARRLKNADINELVVRGNYRMAQLLPSYDCCSSDSYFFSHQSLMVVSRHPDSALSDQH